jgi:5-methylcytosine-specific restriction enzyme subunit McrC
MLPFLVDMNKLFEQFVAEWLRAYLPPAYSLQIQNRYSIGDHENLKFIIDLVLTDVRSGSVISVLDTKYKRPIAPETSDIEQVVAYAEAKEAEEAILVYPITLSKPLA